MSLQFTEFQRAAFFIITALLLYAAHPLTAYGTEVFLTWQDNSNNEDGFNIERGNDESGPFNVISVRDTDSTSYTDTSVSGNETYCYRVTAFNANGSASSMTACATIPPAGEGPEGGHVISFNDFEQYRSGEDPEDWKDTGHNNSFDEEPGLFDTRAIGDTMAFGTDSGDTNIHSHYVGDGSLNWTNYTYTGRIYISDEGSGVGVTFLSRFPEDRDHYYRLRRYAQKPRFYISPHGTSVEGETDSGVIPEPGSWYRFHIEVSDTGTQTNIRAKVWKEGEEEPEAFQIDAYDDSGTRLTSGTIGVWTMGGGSKLYDDLSVTTQDSGIPEEPVNNPPVAEFTSDPNDSVIAGETVTFDASGSYDPEGDSLSYAWDFGDGSGGTGVTADHSYGDPGAYEVTLTVSDFELSAAATSEITVDLPVNSAPVAVISVYPGPSALAGETLDFSAEESYDEDGHSLSYTWDFGDGSSASGARVSHSFSEPGMYEVMLVADDGQLTGTEIVEITIDEVPESLLLSDNFEDYGAGEDPEYWFDTARRNSTNEAPSLFDTRIAADNVVFGTDSRSTNIHSHYNGPDAGIWTNYTYTGRLYISDNSGGIGITFLSRYPDDDVYYRLRRYSRKPEFYISPHGTSVRGETQSGVRAEAGSWYLFRIEVEDTGAQTNIRAKIWKEGEEEPEEFQIDAYDDSGSRITSGTVGVWTMGRGSKLFDDLEVRSRL